MSSRRQPVKPTAVVSIIVPFVVKNENSTNTASSLPLHRGLLKTAQMLCHLTQNREYVRLVTHKTLARKPDITSL